MSGNGLCMIAFPLLINELITTGNPMKENSDVALEQAINHDHVIKMFSLIRW